MTGMHRVFCMIAGITAGNGIGKRVANIIVKSVDSVVNVGTIRARFMPGSSRRTPTIMAIHFEKHCAFLLR